MNNENGFTLVEVIVTALILVIISISIFKSLLQGNNNYIYSEKYYIATLQAQNILEQVKLQLDKDNKNFKSISKVYNNKTYPYNLSDYINIESLALDIDKYSYEVYIRPNTLAGDYSFYYSKLIPPPSTSFSVSFDDLNNSINNNISFQETYNSIEVNTEYDINSLNYNLNSFNDLNIDIKHCKPQDLEINIYTDSDINYNLIAQSSKLSEIRVNFYNNINYFNEDYIIIIIITDNKTSKTLKELVSIYSYLEP